MTAASAPPRQESTRQIRPRLRAPGARLGPLPVANLVVLEIGLALGLALLAMHPGLWWAGLLVALITVPLAVGRWQGRWMVGWIQLGGSYLMRSHGGSLPSQALSPAAGDPRAWLLDLLIPDLTIVSGANRRHEPVGFAWHRGAWTAVLQLDAATSMIAPVGSTAGAAGTAGLPLGALASCLEHRGVVLDAIQVIWHCYPGNTALPPSSPALRSYLEVLGPLPAAARRTVWIAMRLDPRRCPAAVAERGGGMTGCHRALIAALSRVRATLETRGVPARPLDADQLLRAGICAAELSGVAGFSGDGKPVTLSEGWTTVTAAGIGHASYTITGWGTTGPVHNLTALTGVPALSTTVALWISPGEGSGEVGLRGLVRISARNPAELEAADRRLRSVSQQLGVALRPLGGLQRAGLAATLPLGASG
jgi:ESX secretion system protein EccE